MGTYKSICTMVDFPNIETITSKKIAEKIRGKQNVENGGRNFVGTYGQKPYLEFHGRISKLGCFYLWLIIVIENCIICNSTFAFFKKGNTSINWVINDAVLYYDNESRFWGGIGGQKDY